MIQLTRVVVCVVRFSSEVVGATGFEPATPCAQGRCATRLRYAPTLTIPNFMRFLAACSFACFAFLAKIVPELSRTPIDCPRDPHSSSSLSQNSRRLVGRAIELLQRLALRLQLHLRVLLDLGVPLPEQRRHPLVGDAAGAQAHDM